MKQLFSKLFLLSVVTLFAVTAKAQNAPVAPPEEFKPSGKVWGLAFGDYYFKFQNDGLNRGSTQYANQPRSANAFDLRRVYLGYTYNITEKFTAEVILAHEGNTLADNTRAVTIKAANIRWKNIYKNADLVIGQSATPTFSMMSEKFWGYRAVEKTITDMRGIGKSNDLGVALQGKFNSKGDFGYNLMIGNGTAQKIELDRFKKFYGDVYAKFVNQKIVIDLYADYEATSTQPHFHQAKTTYKATLAYQSDPITIGVEAFIQSQMNFSIKTDASLKTDTGDVAAVGFSGFVRGRVIKDKLNFFARYDMYNPNQNYKAENTYALGGASVMESFVTAGLDFTPIKGVHIMPNIWWNMYNNQAKGATGAVKQGNDFVGRLTFWYTFNQ